MLKLLNIVVVKVSEVQSGLRGTSVALALPKDLAKEKFCATEQSLVSFLRTDSL